MLSRARAALRSLAGTVDKTALGALCLAAACSSAGPDRKADTSAPGSKDSTPQTTATPKGATAGGSGGELAYVTNEASMRLPMDNPLRSPCMQLSTQHRETTI